MACLMLRGVARILLINFCILVTLTYLLSLTYRTWPEPKESRWRGVRLGIEALMPLVLLLYPAPIAPGFFADLRSVPVALTTLRTGPGAGLLVALPVMIYRVYLGGAGVGVSFFSMLGVILMVSLARRHLLLHQPQFAWGSSWPWLLLMFFPNALLLPIVAGHTSFYLTVYLPLLALNVLGFVISDSMLASRLRLLHLNATLRLEAQHDALTGLLNRRQFEHDLRNLHPGDALLLLDVDHFKRVNDLHGHQVGDLVLARVARTLEAELRMGDRVYRYGGEEFAALIKTGSGSDLNSVAERLRAQMASVPMPELSQGFVTISVGVAVLSHEGTTPADLLRHADDALYQAKQGGRNRVQVWSGEAEGESALSAEGAHSPS